MTPREADLVLRGLVARQRREAKLMISHAWHTAAFGRAEKLPKLDAVLRAMDGPSRPSPRTWREPKWIAAALMLHTANPTQLPGETP